MDKRIEEINIEIRKLGEEKARLEFEQKFDTAMPQWDFYKMAEIGFGQNIPDDIRKMYSDLMTDMLTGFTVKIKDIVRERWEREEKTVEQIIESATNTNGYTIRSR